MGYLKLKKQKTSNIPAMADFDMSFIESLMITASLDGLIDHGGNAGRLTKGKRIHKLK